jgi:hypothetical protein
MFERKIAIGAYITTTASFGENGVTKNKREKSKKTFKIV